MRRAKSNYTDKNCPNICAGPFHVTVYSQAILIAAKFAKSYLRHFVIFLMNILTLFHVAMLQRTVCFLLCTCVAVTCGWHRASERCSVVTGRNIFYRKLLKI